MSQSGQATSSGGGGGGGTNWFIKTTSFNAVAGDGYIINPGSGTITATLPSGNATGYTLKFIVQNGAVNITAAAGDSIQIGQTNSGAAGSAISNKLGDSLELVFTLQSSPNGIWFAISGPEGTWSVT